MTPAPAARSSARIPGAAALLRVSLVAQCILGVLVVAGDLPADLLRGFAVDAPLRPATAVPVTPGDQTRRFDPRRLPTDRPAGPGFPRDAAVPLRLAFTTGAVPGHADALLLTGSIALGDADRFGDHLATLDPPPGAIALHSPGGSVADALQIGRAIRAAGLPVLVAPGASCFSACPYVLAGGVERTVSRQARVGVHQHYFDENSFLPAFLAVSDVQAGQGEVMAFLDEMGVDPMVMVQALATPPDDIYILLPEELETLKLATTLLE